MLPFDRTTCLLYHRRVRRGRNSPGKDEETAVPLDRTASDRVRAMGVHMKHRLHTTKAAI